jgi:branched-chain amino acid transport system permease protein
MNFIIANLPLLDLILIGTGYAFSQYIVLRSGTFSVATPAFAAIGAYCAAILTVKQGFHPAISVLVSTLVGLGSGLLLSWPLARLRGVYQAIASMAFVEIVLSLNLYSEGLTGGPLGFNGIPRVVTTWMLFVAVVLLILVLRAMGQGAVGRVFDAMRQDVAVAASLGVNPTRYNALAFALSGAIAGLFGALDALRNFSLSPEQFGFPMLVAVLSYVILGGRRSVWGPVVVATILVTLPEIARPLAENRMAIYGLLLVVAIVYMPYGAADTLIAYLKRKRLARSDSAIRAVTP